MVTKTNLSTSQRRANIKRALKKVRAARGGTTGGTTGPASVKSFSQGTGGTKIIVDTVTGRSAVVPETLKFKKPESVRQFTVRQTVKTSSVTGRQVLEKEKIKVEEAKLTPLERKKIARQQVILQTPTERALRTIIVGKQTKKPKITPLTVIGVVGTPASRIVGKTLGGKLGAIRQTFESTLNKRRVNAATISRQLTRKQQEGKKLSGNEIKALQAAGLTNVGIEALDSVTFPFRRPVETAVGTLAGVGAILTRPKETFGAVSKEIMRNPAGFVASIVGTSGAFSLAGKTLRVAGKVGKITSRVVGRGKGKVLRTAGKVGRHKIKIDMKIVSNKLKANLQIKNPVGRVIFDASKTGSKIKTGVARRLGRTLGVTKFQELAQELISIRRKITTLREISFGKKFTQPIQKQIKTLLKKEAKLSKFVNKQKKATTRAGLAKAEIQAQTLKKIVDKSLSRMKKFQKQQAAIKKVIKKRGKAATRRAKVKIRRTARKQAGKLARKEIRKPFRRSKRLEALKNLSDQAKKIVEKKGQLSFKDIQKRLAIEKKIQELGLGSLAGEAARVRTIKTFFKNMNKKGSARLKGKQITELLPPSVKKIPGQIKKGITTATARLFKSKLRFERVRYAGIATGGASIATAVAPIIAAIIVTQKAVDKAKPRQAIRVAPIVKPIQKTKPKIIQKPKDETKPKQIQETIVIPDQRIDNLSPTKQNQIINNIIAGVVGASVLIRPSGQRVAVPQSVRRGGFRQVRKFIFNKLRGKKFVFTPDIYSIIFGIRAKPKERLRLLKPGRTFTGLERRSIVR